MALRVCILFWTAILCHGYGASAASFKFTSVASALVFLITVGKVQMFDASISRKGIGNQIDGASGARFEVTSNTSAPFVITVGKETKLNFDYSITRKRIGNQTDSAIAISASDNYLVAIRPKKQPLPPRSSSGRLKVGLVGKLPGRATLKIQYVSGYMSEQSKENHTRVYALHIQRLETIQDTLFTVVVILLVFATNVGLGCEVNLDVVKDQLKKPIAPAIGLFSQYVFMPLTAYVIVQSFDLMPGIALGLFALGCSPGGSGSNAFSYLLGGDVSLSITMTLVSTVAALGFLPMWLFTLGREFTHDKGIHIPYHIIMSSLVGVVVPCGMGIYIRRKHPHSAQYLVSSIKYLVAFFVLFVFTVGVWINLFVFELMRPRVLVATALLIYFGYFLGGLLAFILGRDKQSIITIAVETGIQNNGIPIMMLRLSLMGPERDTGIVAPIAAAILAPIPICCALIIRIIRKKWKLRNSSQRTKELQMQGQDRSRDLQMQDEDVLDELIGPAEKEVSVTTDV